MSLIKNQVTNLSYPETFWRSAYSRLFCSHGVKIASLLDKLSQKSLTTVEVAMDTPTTLYALP